MPKTEITNAGYQDFRNLVESTWTYFELRDENDNPVTRIHISDSRLSWTHQAGEQVLELTLTVRGSDSDIPTPVIIKSGALFTVAEGGQARHEGLLYALQEGGVYEAVPFIIGGIEDQSTVRYQIEIPEVT